MVAVAESPKRVRQVFPSQQVCHLWAHQSQASARNAGNNVFFNGESIYSYGHHFEIARHVVNDKGDKAILFTTRTYSMTTAKHLSWVRRAIPENVVVFNVYLAGRWTETPEAYMVQYFSRFSSLMEEAKRARSSRVWKLKTARVLRGEANLFAEFYGLSERIELPNNFAELYEEAERIDAKHEEKRAAKRAEENRLWEIANAERIEKAKVNLLAWMNHEGTANDFHFIPNAYFRLATDGETIQTSKGAEFPREHGERAYRLLKRLHDAGQNYHRNGTTIHCGHFAIDSLEGDTIRAGCHTVQWEEIERFAVVMGWNVQSSEGGAV